ncbi:hypothetical protein PG994_006735 [Apiospora phragmitis]|uniref:Uncharacterized protein n=1 Tax=Apiospora phragmitis TaxID=2905665 RepID=A0ABR1VFX1_9PEZI
MSKLYPSAAPALTTVRGFGHTPLHSGDEDSDTCKTPPLTSTSRRTRPQHIGIDDVVSANCSPVLRGQNSPAVSGIAKLRLQIDPLSLTCDSRSSTMTRLSRTNSHQSVLYRSDDDISDNGSTSYEVQLEHDFVSESDPWAAMATKDDKDDPFGGFSFVAPNSLLESNGFAMMAEA